MPPDVIVGASKAYSVSSLVVGLGSEWTQWEGGGGGG